MSRSLVAAGLFVAAALCSAEVEAQNLIYGLVDAAVSRSRPPGGEYQTQLDDGDMSRSYPSTFEAARISRRPRGSSSLRPTCPERGRSRATSAGSLFSRDSNVGFSGQFGTTVLGRTVTPFYLATVNFNPFGDSFAFSPSVRQYYHGALLDERSWNNSISYINNAGGPLRVNVAANTAQGSADPADGGRNYGGSLAYITGPFAATLAYEHVKNTLALRCRAASVDRSQSKAGGHATTRIQPPAARPNSAVSTSAASFNAMNGRSTRSTPQFESG